MGRLFGTDGIRGEAGKFPLDAGTVGRIGGSVARGFSERWGRPPRIVIGRDTRESGSVYFEAAFAAGVEAEKAECSSAGIIPTPGVAFVTPKFDFDLGVVISASHNPYRDNGIKIFSPSGKKIDDILERQIEEDALTMCPA